MPGPMARPTWSPVVSFSATLASWSQSVGMSASVRPAFFQASVLISSASVEKSFGAHCRVSSKVKVSRSDS